MTTPNGSHAVRLPPSASLATLPEQNLYDLSSPADSREETLRDLLKADHGTIAPLREPNLLLHSHMPHVSISSATCKQLSNLQLLTVAQILGSALDLGLGSDFLKEAHDEVVKGLSKIDSTFPRGEKIERSKFKDFIGDKKLVALPLKHRIVLGMRSSNKQTATGKR